MTKTMNRLMKVLPAALLAVIIALSVMIVPVFAEGEKEPAEPGVSASEQVEEESGSDNTIGLKAIAAGVSIGIAALGGALAMGNAVSKSAESISRQPEADGKIRTTLMLGLVFIETTVIYALLAVILIIFVL